MSKLLQSALPHEQPPKSTQLSHKFSNLSVWLCPSNSSVYLDTLNEIRANLTPSNTKPFELHITLFYNIPTSQDSKSYAKDILSKLYISSKTIDLNKNHPKHQLCNISPVEPYTPKDRPLNFFHYPKSADNNTGYDAIILYLTVTGTNLHTLYRQYTDQVAHERAGNNDGKYIPHIALAYHNDLVNPSDYINDNTVMSLWSKLQDSHEECGGDLGGWDAVVVVTEGTVEEWEEVGRVSLGFGGDGTITYKD